MRTNSGPLIRLSMLVMCVSCGTDRGVSPMVALEGESDVALYTVAADPVDPNLYSVTVTTNDDTKFFLNESPDTLIMDSGDSAIAYAGLVEIEDGGAFISTKASASFYTSPSSPSLVVTFYDPLAAEKKESVSYTFVAITSPRRFNGGATYVSSSTYPVAGALIKGRLGNVRAP